MEKNLSDAWSPLVNEAYVCLKKPILRANYLLLLHGMPLQENENIRLGKYLECNRKASWRYFNPTYHRNDQRE